MGFKRGENPNHPKKGASIRVDPIRDLNAIAQIKWNLSRHYRWRDHCLFTLGINTGWRAGELLSIKVGHVRGLKEGDPITLKQSKTEKYRSTPVNRMALRAIEIWLVFHGSDAKDDVPLFPSRQGGTITVPTFSGMVKGWCSKVCISGHFGSHSLRKTWGYHQRVI